MNLHSLTLSSKAGGNLCSNHVARTAQQEKSDMKPLKLLLKQSPQEFPWGINKISIIIIIIVQIY